ncbi:MAG: hypothetical protein KKG64_01650, partial [Firmicutes bacterium]|nr:hypothetical protein [Bacillota bacterium]
YVDVISTQKAQKIKPYYAKIQMLKLNLMEAKSLSQLGCETKMDIEEIGIYFMNQGIKEIFITLGDKGAYYFDGKNHHFMTGRNIPIENTTGAGDAFFAGVIYAKEHQLNPLSCGMAASIITLQDDQAVSPKMNQAQLSQTIKEYQL